jgi:hypothetical protein
VKILKENSESPTNRDEIFSSGETEMEADIPQPTPLELQILRLLFSHEELVPWVALHLDVSWVLHPHIRQIVDLRLAAQEHETWHNFAEFLDTCQSAEQRNLITEVVAENRKIPNPETQLADTTLRLRNQFLDRQISALMNKFNQAETSHDQKVDLLREQLKLKEQRRSPLAQLEK